MCPPEFQNCDLLFSPIESHYPNALPCFLKPDCNPLIEDNQHPEYCTDAYCADTGNNGFIKLATNINGKYGVLFNTQSWGGDNFQFKASIDNPQQNIEDCIAYYAPETIQVWRKIIVDYSWMAKRGVGLYYCWDAKYPNPAQWEHDETHQINDDHWLPFVQGVFDDSYIEIDSYQPYQNTDYWDVMTDLWRYDEQAIGWRCYGLGCNFPYVPFDHVLLMGIDHITEDPNLHCPNGHLGVNQNPSDPYTQQWYDAVCVGNLVDKLFWGLEWYIDSIKYEDYKLISWRVAATELTHTIAYVDDSWDNVDYGVMYDDPAGVEPSRFKRRSYHYHEHIMFMREQLPNFDKNNL